MTTKSTPQRLDSLIERGLLRSETESSGFTIADYIRLLQLDAESKPPENTKKTVIWMDDLSQLDLPEAA